MESFRLDGRVAVVVGGGGILGSAIARGLAQAGADVAICDTKEGTSLTLPGSSRTYKTDALDRESLEATLGAILDDFGHLDILVNAVGGNIKSASTTDGTTFFDIPRDALEAVVDLNLMGGAILPSQVFGRVMVGNPTGGSIINISSMNAYRPLTRIPGYSAAKAAVSNFTQWLATDLARSYNGKVRVNAIAPGFFLTDQNRYLLTDHLTGELSARGRAVIEHTPMGRFGDPDDLIGAAVWLASDASRFVTGIVVPVDGGFSAFAGV